LIYGLLQELVQPACKICKPVGLTCM